jgi:hypothetical protein
LVQGDRQQATDLVAKLRRRSQPAAVKQAGKSTIRRSKEWDRIKIEKRSNRSWMADQRRVGSSAD